MAGNVIVCATCNAIPDNGTACTLAGLLSALSVTENEPVRVPLSMGANATAIEHCAEEDSCVLAVQSVSPEGICVKLAESARLEIVRS